MCFFCSLSFRCQGIMMIMMMNAWLSDLLDRLLPIATVAATFSPAPPPPPSPMAPLASIADCQHDKTTSTLKRCGNSEEIPQPFPVRYGPVRSQTLAIVCIFIAVSLSLSLSVRDACKSLDARRSGNPSVKKLRSPIRRCHLSAVRHPCQRRI